MHHPTAIFNNALDESHFSIISKLYVTICLNRRKHASIIDTVRTKCITFGERLKIRSQKYKQTLCENCSKSTKMAITACKFSKIVRGIMPPDPLESFLLFKLLKINSVGKTTLEKVAKFDLIFLKKILNTPLTMAYLE